MTCQSQIWAMKILEFGWYFLDHGRLTFFDHKIREACCSQRPKITANDAKISSYSLLKTPREAWCDFILVWCSPGKFQQSRSTEGVPGWPWMKGDKSKRINKIKKIDVYMYIYIYMFYVWTKIITKSRLDVPWWWKVKKTTRWRHLESSLWPKAQREVNTLMSNCLAAWRREVLQMVTLTLWSLCYGGLGSEIRQAQQVRGGRWLWRRRCIMYEIGVKGTVDVSQKNMYEIVPLCNLMQFVHSGITSIIMHVMLPLTLGLFAISTGLHDS